MLLQCYIARSVWPGAELWCRFSTCTSAAAVQPTLLLAAAERAMQWQQHHRSANCNLGCRGSSKCRGKGRLLQL
jgi:hypothetical protein